MTISEAPLASERRTNPQGPLVSTQWLEDHLDDPDVLVLEVSFYPLSEADYPEGHVPGAVFAYWKDLLWHETDREFVSPTEAADRLGRLGVGDTTTIALVGDPFQFAAYAYWVLTMAGLEHRCVLVDGGRKTWIAEQRHLTTDVPETSPAVVSAGTADMRSRVGRDEVREGLGASGPVLIDMRSPEEYRGERVSPPWVAKDHGAERKGHIPGARNLFFEDLLTEAGALKARDELAAAFDAVGATHGAEVVTYCRLSHRGSLAWFVLTRVLGRSNVRVYDGSWTEWGSIVGFPVER